VCHHLIAQIRTEDSHGDEHLFHTRPA
jgi:hypothetical protein